MSFADLKLRARRQVHKTFAVPCLYQGPNGTPPVSLSARFHNRIVVGGDIGSSDYATIIENVTHLVFSREELVEQNVRLAQRGTATFPDYENMVLELDAKDPYEGPITERWSVAVVTP